MEKKKIERKILLNPGPATTSDSVKYAQVVSDICPREEEFTQVMEEVRKSLVKIAQGDENYACILFFGSGTAAMDSVINSVVHDKKILIINNGAYGERFVQIAKSYGIDYVELKFDMHEEIDVSKIEEKIKKDKEIGYVAMVHHETTTGILNPVKEIGDICKKYSCVFIVDTVSSFAGVPFSVKDCNMDFIMSTSNKCIQAVPGVCCVIAKKIELNKLKKKKKRSFYLDLYDQYEYFEKKKQTRFTAPVHAIYSLRQAIKELFEEGGVEGRYRRYCKNYEVLIKGLKELGFKPMHDEKFHSKISTTVLEPKNLQINFKELHDRMYERGFTIYPNKVGDKNSIRFANMGDINSEDIKVFLKNFREVLKELKKKKK